MQDNTDILIEGLESDLAIIRAENARLREALKILIDGFSHIGVGKNSKAVIYVTREDWTNAYSILESANPENP